MSAIMGRMTMPGRGELAVHIRTRQVVRQTFRRGPASAYLV